MKHITCFTANMVSGGAQHQMALLSGFLSERGYDVTIVTYNNLPDHYPTGPRVKRINLNLEGSSLKKMMKLSRFLWKWKTDCIISYRSTPNFMLLIPMFFKRDVKIIAGERNLTVIPNIREKINYQLLYYRPQYIVPNSFSQGRYLVRLNKSWKSKVVPITNYTAIDEYIPQPVHISDDIIHIGVISRIFPQKNYERFCEMLSMLKNKTSGKFKVYWYGDRQDGEYLKGSMHIHELIERNKIYDVLEVKNAVKNVAELMDSFHFMCLPSLFEGFSNSLSEYICCGKPVVCSDVSDNSLMVHDGENGFLFDPKDIESMCNAFQKMLSLSQEQMKKMGEKSREIAEELFNKDKFIEKYVELIEN